MLRPRERSWLSDRDNEKEAGLPAATSRAVFRGNDLTTYYTLRTDTWIMSLPSDWEQRDASSSSSLYFEAGDGTKGLYISTWKLREDDARAAEQVAKVFRANDLKSLDNMGGYQWRIVDDMNDAVHDASISVTDCMAENNNYRVIGKIIAAPPFVVRASFHDYACIDYAASRAYFAPLIESLCLLRE